MKIRLFALFVGATLASPLASIAHAETVGGFKVYNNSVSVGVAPNLNLSPIQRRGLREFRRARSYFGALYVSTDGTSYQHFINWHDLDGAKFAARNGCEIVSEGVPCVLAAVSVPKGVDPNGSSTKALSSSAQGDLKRYRSRQVQGRYGAFAVSNSAHQGYSHNWVSEAEARGAAKAFCDSAVARDLTTLGNEGRAIARKRGFTTCRVIATTGPDH